MNHPHNLGSENFDAIVIGSGISGGWAAKELTEKGLNVLVLDRGRPVEHGQDYYGEHAPNWKLPFQGKSNRKLNAQEQPIQSQCYAFNEANRKFFINDKDNPYSTEDKHPFLWLRSDIVGGRSVLWGRQTYRWSAQDFTANKDDGKAIDWPIRYDDLAPWYSYVEKFIGVSGEKEGLSELPDGEFLKPMEYHALEKTIKGRLSDHAPDVTMTMGRAAILTEHHNGRAACHYCGPCYNGCSTGSYFSSQSSTLPAARATGRLTLLSDMLVEKLIYDEHSQKVSQVQVIHTPTEKRKTFSAKLFFLCASTLATTQILLNSKSKSFPNGLANSSGTLGRYLMDHMHDSISATGVFFDDMDKYYQGNRPNGTYIPRFQNLPHQPPQSDFTRGYGFQANVLRADWTTQFNQKGFGPQLKETLRKPGPWIWNLGGFAECLPQADNRVTLHPSKTDRFGIPQVHVAFSWSDNEKAMWQHMTAEAKRIMRAAGAAIIFESQAITMQGGSAIHEMGTARMGRDASTSVLNQHNQAHDVANLFITDGSCMTSSSCVNPSITYMALTARACDYAVKQLAAGNT